MAPGIRWKILALALGGTLALLGGSLPLTGAAAVEGGIWHMVWPEPPDWALRVAPLAPSSPTPRPTPNTGPRAASVQGAAGSIAISIGPLTGSSSRLAFTAQPVRAAAGYALGVQPVVAVKDAQGAVVVSDNGSIVTLAVAADAGPSGALLHCDQTSGATISATVASGVAAFAGCVIDQPGAGYLLEATAPGLASARTAAFNVTLAGDTNGDCHVTVQDFSLLVTYFGAVAGDPAWTGASQLAYRADLNGDARISVVDFSMLVTRFGATAAACPPPSDGSPIPTP